MADPRRTTSLHLLNWILERCFCGAISNDSRKRGCVRAQHKRKRGARSAGLEVVARSLKLCNARDGAEEEEARLQHLNCSLEAT